MSQLEDVEFPPQDFSGKVRLFPLHQLVLFPHVLQPLHIFEPRYLAMLEDSMRGDSLIAMAVLAAGWEQDDQTRPALHPMACLGRIAATRKLEDGRCNILLIGMGRVALKHELPSEKPFREASVTVCHDNYRKASAVGREDLTRQLTAVFRKWLARSSTATDELSEILRGNVSLGMLTDLMAYALGFDVEFKAQLLRECDVDRRARLLLEKSSEPSATSDRRRYPLDFSLN